MASSFQGVINDVSIFVPTAESQKAQYRGIYSKHGHRIYSLAFWMTDNELLAEQLASNTFLRAFASTGTPTTEQIDHAFLTEVRELIPVGTLTLSCLASSHSNSVRGNLKRIDLERALVQLPATERLIFLFHDVEGYSHERIGRLLGTSERESQYGLHQARIQIRELVSRSS
jgi:RNA polymerase sigma-70 factor (ECF subfamily)